MLKIQFVSIPLAGMNVATASVGTMVTKRLDATAIAVIATKMHFAT